MQFFHGKTHGRQPQPVVGDMDLNLQKLGNTESL